MTPRTKAGIVLAGVFLFGGVAGAGASRAYMFHEFRSSMEGPPGQARAHFRLEAMRRHLDLKDDQVTKLEAILRDSESERDKRMAACRPGMDELRTTTEAKINELLTPEQRKRYQELHGPFGGGPPPPPPPPPP